MELIPLSEGPSAYRCPETGGHYIPAISYMRWLAKLPVRAQQQPPTTDQLPEIETESPAYLCPETGTIMTRYKVGHGFRFSIDRSITGGVWLDAGEWEELQKRGFHEEIHFVFTDPWQRGILRDQLLNSRRERLEERIGGELLQRVDELRAELAEHPHRDEIFAYLMNK